ncbi:MAG: D-aminoacyl-tRNA deacylase [Anaerolineae bacterium]
MRALVQRVARAAVKVGGTSVANIGPGLLILLGVRQGDSAEQAAWLADKVANLRIFEDEAGKMNLSILDVGGQALVIPQFTLYADAQKGRRPSFSEAAPPQLAEPLVAAFIRYLKDIGLATQSGVFAAHMLVEIHNDGPVTILLER